MPAAVVQSSAIATGPAQDIATSATLKWRYCW